MDTVRRGMKELLVFFWTLIYVQMFSTESLSKKCDDIAKTRFKSYFEKF